MLNGGDREVVSILLFSEFTLFEPNVSTVLSLIVIKIVLVKTQPMLTPKKKSFITESKPHHRNPHPHHSTLTMVS